VHFNNAHCLEKCTKHETGEFSLTWDESVFTDLLAHLIGYVSMVTKDREPLKTVTKEFHQYLKIMGKEAADTLAKHQPYDCKIDLQEGSTTS